MRSKLTLAGVAAVVLCALLPMKTGGCGGKTACIAVTPDEYAKTGRCPSVDEMGEFFHGSKGDPCGFNSDVSSIDGEGTYDGALCCYPVTKFDDQGGFTEDCFGGFGTGGVGGFGGGGFGGGCASCAEFIAQPGVPPTSVCGSALFLDMTICGCDACPECDLNLCKDFGPTTECLACIDSSCPNEVNACVNEF